MTKYTKWKKEFIKEFVNDHGTEWRPLRGLWVEEVTEFIQNLIDKIKLDKPSVYTRPKHWSRLHKDYWVEGYTKAVEDEKELKEKL